MKEGGSRSGHGQHLRIAFFEQHSPELVSVGPGVYGPSTRSAGKVVIHRHHLHDLTINCLVDMGRTQNSWVGIVKCIGIVTMR
jgi:hypothetical protein